MSDLLILETAPSADDFQVASIEVMERRVDIRIGHQLDGSVSMRCLVQAQIEIMEKKGVPKDAIPSIMLFATRFLLIGILAERRRESNVQHAFGTAGT